LHGKNDYPKNGNTKMDLHGLDIANNKTSAGKEGDAISTQCIYKCDNTFYTTCLAEINECDFVLTIKDMYIPKKSGYINRKLIPGFISLYIDKLRPQ
jgi:hypothetical protein